VSLHVPFLGRVMINVDVSATAFFQSGPLTDIIAKILGLRSPGKMTLLSFL
jgi:eukaryotic translation initiation factor 2C